MGVDPGRFFSGLVFEPRSITICKGDSIKWVNNKNGPHNVVFDIYGDYYPIPNGVDMEKITMDDKLMKEGDSYTVKFDVKGDYGYYCEPHRAAAMNGSVHVI